MCVSYNHQYIPSTADTNLDPSFRLRTTHKNRTVSGMSGEDINSAHLMRKSADNTVDV